MIALKVRLGSTASGEDTYVPMNCLVPMVNPNDLVIGGWDINNMNLADAMERAKVLDWGLQQKLRPYMKDMVPLPSIYIPDFIAANQKDRANNVLEVQSRTMAHPADPSQGTKEVLIEKLRKDIRDFKEKNKLDKVIILWSANTERYADIVPGVNDTADNLLAAIKVRPSHLTPLTPFTA